MTDAESSQQNPQREDLPAIGGMVMLAGIYASSYWILRSVFSDLSGTDAIVAVAVTVGVTYGWWRLFPSLVAFLRGGDFE